MRIKVTSINTAVTEERRAYAEYRLFSAIAPYERRIRSVEVVLRQDSAARSRVLCTVTVDLLGIEHVKTQARAVHSIAAIDRAADRAAWLVGRRIAQDFSVKVPTFTS